MSLASGTTYPALHTFTLAWKRTQAWVEFKKQAQLLGGKASEREAATVEQRGARGWTRTETELQGTAPGTPETQSRAPGSLTHVGGSPAFSNDLAVPLAALRSPRFRLCIPPGLDTDETHTRTPLSGRSICLRTPTQGGLGSHPSPPPSPLANTRHLVTPSIRRLWAIIHPRLTLNQLHLHRPPPRREEIPQL